MTTESSKPTATDAQAPFGTHPRQPKLPLVFLGLLCLAWFAVLFWMAAFKAGN